MPSYQPPLKNAAYVFYVSLVSQANTKIMQASATLATGDVKAAVDDAAPANLATLPVVDADYTKRIKVSLSAAEMNGDRVTVIFSDASGAEWCDLTVDIATVTNQFDSLATQASVDTVDNLLDSEVAAILAAVDTEVAALVTSVGLLPTAAAIWAYVTRTLTSTAAAVAAAMTGDDLTVTRAVTFSATITGLTISATWTKIYFSVKRSPGQPDSDALIQIVETNPGVGTDGLLYLDGAAAVTAAQASLTVDQALGTIIILITDDATAALPDTDVTYSYDLKQYTVSDSASTLLVGGDLTVTNTPTEAIA